MGNNPRLNPPPQGGRRLNPWITDFDPYGVSVARGMSDWYENSARPFLRAIPCGRLGQAQGQPIRWITRR